MSKLFEMFYEETDEKIDIDRSWKGSWMNVIIARSSL